MVVSDREFFMIIARHVAVVVVGVGAGAASGLGHKAFVHIAAFGDLGELPGGVVGVAQAVYPGVGARGDEAVVIGSQYIAIVIVGVAGAILVTEVVGLGALIPIGVVAPGDAVFVVVEVAVDMAVGMVFHFPFLHGDVAVPVGVGTAGVVGTQGSVAVAVGELKGKEVAK